MYAKDEELEKIGAAVLDSCITVHRILGPGLLESVYEKALMVELLDRGYKIESQKEIPVTYRNMRLECGFRADLIVEDKLLLELKAIDSLAPVHKAQVLTYLKLTGLTLGFLINFNVTLLKNGFQRIVLNHPDTFSSRS